MFKIFNSVFRYSNLLLLRIEDLQNQIKDAERKVDEKRSILETSQVLECEQDDAEKISLMEQICVFVFFHFQLLCQLSDHQMQEVLGWILDIHSDRW